MLDDPQSMAYLKSMAKKQTRRSISVSKGTYERLKTYCEANGISMSQFIERRVGDYLSCSQTLPDEVPMREVHEVHEIREVPEVREIREVREEPVATKPSRPLTPDQIFTF
jgi:hypothetical protein